MATFTTRHGFTFMEISQQQKEATFNEALALLDMLTNALILDRDLATPPGSPTDGDLYIVGPAASGDWAGKDGQLAAYYQGWWFLTAPEGFLALVDDEETFLYYSDGSWLTLAAGGAGGGLWSIDAPATEVTNHKNLGNTDEGKLISIDGGGVNDALVVLPLASSVENDTVITIRKDTGEDTSNLLFHGYPNNMLLYSEELDNAAWAKANLTVVADQTLDQDSNNIMDRLEETTDNDVHEISQSFSKPSGTTTVHFQIVVKPDERSEVVLLIDDGTATNQIDSRFTLTGGGSVSDNNSNGSYVNTAQSIGTVANGNYLLSLEATVPVTQENVTVRVRLYNGGQTYAGVLTEGLFAGRGSASFTIAAPIYTTTTSTASVEQIDGVNSILITEDFKALSVVNRGASWTQLSYAIGLGANGIETQDDSVQIVGSSTTLNFTGPGVVISDEGGGTTGIDIPGHSMRIEDEGSQVIANASAMNFVGSAVNVTDGGAGEATVTITQGEGWALTPVNDGSTLIHLQASDEGKLINATTTSTALVVLPLTDTATPERLMSVKKTGAGANPVVVHGYPRNMIGKSEELDDAAWTKARLTVNANFTNDPLGNPTMDKLEETAETGAHEIRQAFSKPEGATKLHAYAVVKPDERDHVYLFIDQGSSTNRAAARFELIGSGTEETNFSNGTATYVSSSITTAANGNFIVKLEATVPATAADWEIALRLYNGGQTYLGVVTEGLSAGMMSLSFADTAPDYFANSATTPLVDKIDGADTIPLSSQYSVLSAVVNDANDEWLQLVKDASAGSDADTLDGQEGAFYQNADNLNAGTVPAARLSGTYNIDVDTVDGLQASAFVQEAGDNVSGALTFTETTGLVRFGSANETNTDDGKIGAGLLGEGLNIVGTQTVAAAGRKIRTFGDMYMNDGTAISGSPVAFSVIRTGAAQTTLGLVSFESEQTDVRGDFDNVTNYRFTAPVDGTYVFFGSLLFITSPAGSSAGWMFRKNGANIGMQFSTTIDYSGGGNQAPADGKIILTLVAGDYIDIALTTLAGGASLPAGNYATFSGHLL